MRTLIVFCFLVALTGAAWTAAAQDPPTKQDLPAKQDPPKKENPDDTISVETNQVLLHVTVTNLSDEFVRGLKRGDFSIFEDKQPQRLAGFSVEESPFAAAILIDASGSMENKMTLARAACTSFVEGIREDDHFAIYTFAGSKVKQVQPFGDVKDVGDFLWDLRADGMTPMYDALVKAADDLAERPEQRRAILLVSDGGDSTSRASFDDAVRHATKSAVTVYCVDLSDRGVYKATPRDNGDGIMKTLAAKTGGRFYATPGGSALRDAFAQTVNELRSQYTLAYDPTNEKKDGKWRVVEVRLNKPGLHVRTRQGYYAPKEKR